VTEHVTELQTPAQFAQSMIDGKFPDGAIPQGVSNGYNWEDGTASCSWITCNRPITDMLKYSVTLDTYIGRGKTLVSRGLPGCRVTLQLSKHGCL
jgi:hypothetical protein